MSTDLRTTADLSVPLEGLRRHRRARMTEGRVVFAVVLLCYLGAAGWFWRNHLIHVDAVSRVANAYYVLFSRDPHLAAVGFVWNPLPSLVMLPLLPLKALIPALTRDGLAAGLTSALFMAGTVAVGNDIFRRMGVSAVPRTALTVLLALHPMMIIYGGNGTSEACFMFFLVLSVRGLLIWLTGQRPESLVALGLSLSLAYGARYEALAPGVAVPAVVAAVTWWRGRGRARWRYATAQTDAVIVGLPVFLAVAGWALASKIIVGQWFATFSSEYGNSAQVASNAQGIESVTGVTLGARTAYALHQILGLQPLVPLLLILAAVMAVRRRDPRMIAPLTVLGAVLAFDELAFLAGGSFGWLRFQITVVPLAALLAGALLAAPPGAPATRGRSWRSARVRRLSTVAVAVLAAALAVPTTVVTLRSPVLAREESDWFTRAGVTGAAQRTGLDQQIARDIDGMALPDGAVIADSAYAFAIILASGKPRQFIITPDRDFAASLADPRRHRVRYLLQSAFGPADAVRAGARDAGSRPEHTWTDTSGAVRWSLIPVPSRP
ncbi:hypothetical protein AB0M46_02450 [Dactylosporangium sp. NPDC051485]|uniref:hypothetical protein n=1 Tax=Dactylosporangium sp. NPDC051485 TaxID=3154846 RepID=UPI0034124547